MKVISQTLRVVGAIVLLFACSLPVFAQTAYTTKMTSGPFLVVPGAKSVDWIVISNETEPVDVAVTVYRYSYDGSVREPVPNFTIPFTLLPGQVTHNANSVGFPGEAPYQEGNTLEVVIEATAGNVHAMVNQWSCNGSTCVMPETVIPAGDFITIKEPKEKGRP